MSLIDFVSSFFAAISLMYIPGERYCATINKVSD